MTTNLERCRALHWGSVILNELLIEPSAPVDFVDLVRELLPVLPDHAVIAALGQGAEIKLTPSQAGTVRDSRVLLEQLAAAGVAVTVDGRDVIEATLRHFPLAYEDNAGFLCWPAAPTLP